MLFDQLAHARVARAVRGAAQDHCDDVPVVAPNRRGEVVAGRFGVAGLDAVDALDVSEQAIVVAHLRAFIFEARRREILIVEGKAMLDGAPEQRLVARGGDLFDCRQPRRVDIGRFAQAERARLARHHQGELLLAAAQRLGHHHRRVVGGFGD